ncbi:MAG: polysaccharide deacetylase family protein [Verrucomicrobiota bacterium]
MIRVTQSWDDGVHDDVRLIELLRKYQAKATFNLISSAHRAERFSNWKYQDTKPVYHLALSELVELYRGFEVASHTVTHPHLEQLPPEKVAWELAESRKQLEDIFQRPIGGLAYPFGTCNAAVKEEARRQGYRYARAGRFVPLVFPPADPMEFGITVWFSDEKFWAEFERVKQTGGVFHFVGHSYEFVNEAMWTEFEAKLARLSADSEVHWMTNLELFTTA